jgi:hypothetical protein
MQTMKYKYIGDGAGIIGLPHEITDEEAAALEVADLLQAALANGAYVSVETVTRRPERVHRAVKDGDKESEVNNG